ncbi:MAG: YihY/virulence factor BrkB family protein [Bacteroidota bacterium]|nr:YihY/virulence factor BrkB family protein [Bacteroidota bacterium]
MSEVEARLRKIPIVRNLVAWAKQIKFKKVQYMSLYDIMELYIIGIIEGAFTNRAAAIAFSFFMAIFPFLLFILNLLPYMPLDNFQADFFRFLKENVPPNTYDAIHEIILDIMSNSNKGLLSSGVIMAIFLMANGVSSMLSGFENSYHVTITRNFIRQYIVSLVLGIVLSLVLLFTVFLMVVSEILIINNLKYELFDSSPLILCVRYVFLVLLILFSVSLLFKFGSKQLQNTKFISIGSLITTGLIILSSYGFGIYVLRFAKYNELYGSIGTILVIMVYIWLICMILLLGFELNATINRLKNEKIT